VDDLADGLYYLLNTEDPPDWINIGSGEDLPILELAQMVAKVVGFEGSIEHDLSKPDGTPRKLMAADRIRELGWKPSIALEDGIRDAYQDFLKSDYREA
jgi:GDP-L-fucose synthase